MNQGIQTLFNQWWWGYLFIPFFLSVVGGIIGANLGVYRELQRRLYDEWRFIRRRIYVSTTEPIPWEIQPLIFSGEMEQIIHELRFRRFDQAADALDQRRHELINFMRAEYFHALERLEKKQPPPQWEHLGQLGYAQKAADAYMRRAVDQYLRNNLARNAIEVLRQRPDISAVIDTPTFQGWIDHARITCRDWMKPAPSGPVA